MTKNKSIYANKWWVSNLQMLNVQTVHWVSSESLQADSSLECEVRAACVLLIYAMKLSITIIIIWIRIYK